MEYIFGKLPSEIAYLVGAGISTPLPSALPDASAFISSLADAITDDPKLRAAILSRTFSANSNKRFKGDFLRFEAIMGCIKLAIDPELQLLRVYGECAIPNSYHFFLAEQLKQGVIVLTTNFDNLIEIACRTRGIDYSLVVSDEQLNAFIKSPSSIRHPLIKLHGGYDLVDSGGYKQHGVMNIKATLQDVGTVYLGSRSDQLTSVLTTIMNNRHLVVIGYSGCDDFDIMPCLMKEHPLKGITWIDHNDQATEVIEHPSVSLPDLPPYRLLTAHGQIPSTLKIFRGVTSRILGIEICNAATNKRFYWNQVFANWAKEYLASNSQKSLLLGHILATLERWEESVEILESISRDTLLEWQLEVLYFELACLYIYLNDTKRAILMLSDLADSEREIAGVPLKGFAYYNLARLNTNMGQYTEAKMYLDTAMKIFERVRDHGRICDCLHELGRIGIETGHSDSAIKNLEMSVKISEMAGDIVGAAISYGEIARALCSQGNLDEAEAFAQKAMNLLTLHGNQTGLGIAHHTLGYILAMREDYAGAASEFKRAIEYERSVGDKLDLGHSLHALGDMYLVMKEVNKAQECLKESLRIKREINDKKGIANSEKLLQVIELIKAQRI